MIDDVILTPLKIIDVPGGDVLHAMKCDDPGYSGFGEAYFSTIESGEIKAWKKHREMTLNLIVPVGEIRFVIFDDRMPQGDDRFQDFSLSRKNYCRLTIPPMIWFGFQGVSDKDAILLNIANIPHDPNDIEKKEINEIEFDWSLSL